MDVAFDAYEALASGLNHSVVSDDLKRIIIDDFTSHISRLVAAMSDRITSFSIEVVTSGSSTTVSYTGTCTEFKFSQCVRVSYRNDGKPTAIVVHTELGPKLYNLHTTEYDPHVTVMVVLPKSFTTFAMEKVLKAMLRDSNDVEHYCRMLPESGSLAWVHDNKHNE